MPVCEMDVRPGGRYRSRWRSDSEDKAFGFFDKLREVDAPARMVHEENYDPGEIGGAMDASNPAIIRTSLSEKAEATPLEMVMKSASKEIRDAVVSTGMTDSMELGYERLDGRFTEQREADPSVSTKR